MMEAIKILGYIIVGCSGSVLLYVIIKTFKSFVEFDKNEKNIFNGKV